ncbi:helix-turn-helix domain-containing protein [Roseivirga sp. UBA1976]|uniref:helix-turn-helix domain-containing protein n=1 Tax=Roseivirga sp. UBA1976 TaxID=1947386 RepID=UPI0025809E9D|nr:helix-turn-helix domain-containing protein [Roseivirga sp. UBA1976]|tara:strand:+ start:3213 stop:3689 length:477 start_codon:yes stop_codon:yes gene_type:complete
MELHEQAFKAYCEGLTQKQIATIVGRTEQTISAWAKKYDWENKRDRQLISQENAEEGIWKLINHNVAIHLRIAALKIKELDNNQNPTVEDLKKALTDNGDVDALKKLHASIKGKQHAWGDYINFSKELLEYMQENHFDKAKELAPILDEFLSQKRKEL